MTDIPLMFFEGTEIYLFCNHFTKRIQLLDKVMYNVLYAKLASRSFRDMKKLIEVSLKSIIFFIGWAIFVSVIPIPDIDNTALWRFFAELIPFLAIVVMTVIFWFVDRKKTKLHLTQRPVYSSV